MQTIQLNKHEWKIDPQARLGPPGGFGEVFRGFGRDGPVAIKRLKITAAQAAHREMQIGYDLAQRRLNHVVPIFDAGQDANSDRYYLVMPICDESLHDNFSSLKAGFPVGDAITVMLKILSGLDEVSDLVHRDLKPSNVLLYEGVWKIADFGIAKFVEDSTSLQTLRANLTPAYAAPEQWGLMRPTAATDIYALGCIAHVLMTGAPPFSGDIDALREQHLNQTAPSIGALPPRARALVSQMLRKAPQVRPKRSRCIEVLQEVLDSVNRPSGRTPSLLAEAVSAVAIEQAQRETERQILEERQRQRDALFEEARQDLTRIRDALFSTIRDHAADLVYRKRSSGSLAFGKAIVTFDTSVTSWRSKGIQKCYGDAYSQDNGWGAHKRNSSRDLIAHCQDISGANRKLPSLRKCR
jgi:eukaryotic-like serine/threonine-protein kinase